MSHITDRILEIERDFEFDIEICINTTIPEENRDRQVVLLSTEFPRYDSPEYSDIKEKIIGTNKRAVLISEANNMVWVNRLLWECDNVVGVLYVDTQTPYSAEVGVTSANRMLWDLQANRSVDNNKAYMSGWRNSYNNELFSNDELEEYISNTYTKLKDFLNPQSSVLEVGIGSGMISDRLSKFCQQYDGCDISQMALDKLAESNKNNGITNVNLYLQDADKVNMLPNKYDVILMSSVTEYFSGYNYLRDVVDSCILSLNEGRGVIFFGDVFDLKLKEMYKNDVLKYAALHPDARSSTSFSHELFIPYDFWYDLANSISQISGIHITHKLGIIPNEINRFRYDVFLTIDSSTSFDKSSCVLHKYQWGI